MKCSLFHGHEQDTVTKDWKRFALLTCTTTERGPLDHLRHTVCKRYSKSAKSFPVACMQQSVFSNLFFHSISRGIPQKLKTYIFNPFDFNFFLFSTLSQGLIKKKFGVVVVVKARECKCQYTLKVQVPLILFF